MDRISLLTVATGVALLFATAIHAQQQPSSPPPPPAAYGAPISLEQAKAAIAPAAGESKKNGWNHVFAIKLIGAIGVSGATPLQDHQSAEAGVAAVK